MAIEETWEQKTLGWTGLSGWPTEKEEEPLKLRTRTRTRTRTLSWESDGVPEKKKVLGQRGRT